MVNIETLTARSLRHYELGRMRMALRVALVLGPVIGVCLLERIARDACGCSAALLVGVCVWLRFRSRAGVDSVTTGLLAGAIPLSAALLLTQIDPGCATARPLSLCTAFSVLVGGLAGVVVALRERARPSLSRHWWLAAGIALLAASLGCARLGVVSVISVALGVVVGRASMRPARGA
jgi:hypothetical protein